MRVKLSDGYECEIVDTPACIGGAFNGIPYEAMQAPISREHIFDGDTGKPITKAQFKAMCHPMDGRA